MKSAVLFDGVPENPGGACDVAIHIAEALDADLHILNSRKDISWWKYRVDFDVYMYNNLPDKFCGVYSAYKSSIINLDEYDCVVTTGPGCKFYQVSDGQKHYHYMHHPPLHYSLWYPQSDWKLLRYPIKTLDKIETKSIETVICNSNLTADRFESHYGEEPEYVIPPPVGVDKFDAKEGDGYAIIVGRIDPRKRTDLAVKAAQLFNYDLKVVGGTEEEYRELYDNSIPSNVTFEGHVSENRLISLMENASTGLFLSKREDFGIVPIEYLASGTPVVGVDEPNTNNQIGEDNGVLVEPNVHDVKRGVIDVMSTEYNQEMMGIEAKGYDSSSFKNRIQEVIYE